VLCGRSDRELFLRPVTALADHTPRKAQSTHLLPPIAALGDARPLGPARPAPPLFHRSSTGCANGLQSDPHRRGPSPIRPDRQPGGGSSLVTLVGPVASLARVPRPTRRRRRAAA